jgi:hypothetical protein
MHGINEIKDFNRENQEAQRILAEHPAKEKGKDWLVAQEALNNYLKAKYGNQQNGL